MRSPESHASEFFSKFPCAKSIIKLFEFLPGTCFYAKDTQHRYIGVNQSNLTNVFGLKAAKDLLGRTDMEFQPPVLAEAYHAEDRRVISLGETIANQIWLVPHVRGTPHWYVSTKTPLFDRDDTVVGLAGVMYPIETPQDQRAYFQDLGPVVDHISRHYASTISMKSMAAKAGLSSTQFNQRFQTVFRMSPTEFVLSLRIRRAQRLLTETSKSLIVIAGEVGFFDQSHFTKRFRHMTGLTPRAYRTRFR